MRIMLSLCGERKDHKMVSVALSWLSGKKLQQERLPMDSTFHKVSRCWKESPSARPLSWFARLFSCLQRPPLYAHPIKKWSVTRAGYIQHMGLSAPIHKTMRPCEISVSLTPLPVTPAGITGQLPKPSTNTTCLRIFFQRIDNFSWWVFYKFIRWKFVYKQRELSVEK